MSKLEAGTIIDERYEVIDFIHSGEAGDVYRVNQLGGTFHIERALKILSPKLPHLDQENFRKGFLGEIEKLSQLTHRNLVKLISASEHKIDGTALPYYVMDLVHPPANKSRPLDLATWADQVADREEFVNTLLQLTNGLSYLHAHNFLHCDIKPGNVLLELASPGEYNLKLSDLGASKLVLQAPYTDPHSTYVIGTQLYCPIYAINFVNTGKPVTQEILSSWFPHFDLFCLGATLAHIISGQEMASVGRDLAGMTSKPKANIERLFNGDYEVLKRIILRLVGPPEQCFERVVRLRDAIIKLKSDYLLPLGVKEMVIGGAYKTLTQPTEKIFLSKRAYRIVGHPIFQRLHNLNQLNFSYMLYSGARHSRFSHSLATFEMAKRYIEALLGDPYFKYSMYKEDFELFLAASLLHDVGHYPLAHAIEDLRDVEHEGVQSQVKADHDMADRFLALEVGSDNLSLAFLLRRDWGIDSERLVRLISKSGTPKNEPEYLMKSMLDGPIDIDKVSYLIDDSYFTGARYGLGIDLDGLLAALVVIPYEPKTEEKGERHNQLGISDQGVVPAEGVVSARYSMFSRVYWHHFNRGIMAMLSYAAAKVFLSSLRRCTFDEYVEKTIGLTDIEAVRFLSDRLNDLVADPKTENITNPLTGLLDGSRSVHKRFMTFRARGSDPDIAMIQNYLVSITSYSHLEKVRGEIRAKIGDVVGMPDALGDSEVLLDVPRRGKTFDDELKPLYVNDQHGCVHYQLLRDHSNVVRSLCEEFEGLTKKSRIYVSPRLGELLEGEEEKSKTAKAEVQKILLEKAKNKQ